MLIKICLQGKSAKLIYPEGLRMKEDLNLPLGFPGGSDGKASAYNAGDLGSIPGSGRSPGEENGNPLQMENPIYGGALIGYSPRGCKKSDTTE